MLEISCCNFITLFSNIFKVNAKRSGEVILVKNLPHGTKPVELRNIFGKFGDLEKVLLPPSGITAIVQFVHPTEARTAFKSLAFSKVSLIFKGIRCLYLY